MDYIPVNVNMEDGELQGDYFMNGVGPYDMWAIEYGYSSTTRQDHQACRRGRAHLRHDEDTGGPDPLARRYDFTADPRDYAASRMKLSKYLRERLLEKFVQGWRELVQGARRGYQITLSTQTDAVNIMASWLGRLVREPRAQG
jgi:hypothetical protein